LRRSWTGWLSAALVSLCCVAPAGAAQETTRVFAMQPKLDVAWMASRQSYRDKLFELADASLRGTGGPLIQDGADDVASHLRPDGRNLVVWPEDIGLWSAFTGRRAAAARKSGSAVGAIGALFTAYAPQNSYYAQKFPAVAQRVPQVRLLALSLTDTFARTAVETFSEMAAKYHVWLEAGVDMAQSWHVVCVTDEHPPQEPCDEQNAAKVQALGDPDEPSRGYVYEATSPNPSNMALVFGPNGKLVSKQVKTYLVPTELGRPEGQVGGLDLVPGSITGGLSPVHTPVGTLGFVTSKDAWMPDVVDRLEAEHVDLLIQPEFFAGDLVTTSGMWAPDTLKASGFSDVQRHPGFAAMALPSAVGNVFDFSSDAQSHIVERLNKPASGQWLVGQPIAPGLTALPWVVPDPIRKNESIAERRKLLGEAGTKLVPGSGVKCASPSKPGPCENGQVEGVLWKDVRVGWPDYGRVPGHKKTRFLAARPLSRQAFPERNAAVAMRGRYVVVAFEAQRPEGDRVMVAASNDGGRHWGLAKDAAPDRGGDQRWPAITVTSHGSLTLAWTEGAGPVSRVVFAQGRIAGNVAAFAAARPIDPDSPADATQWKPALALGEGVVHAAFIDARARSADANLPQASVYYTRIGPNGSTSPPVRLSGGRPAPLSAELDNAWSPSIVARGRTVFAAWLDFRAYDWDVISRISSDGGKVFAAAVDSNREPADVENLSDSPRPLLTKRGPIVVWTDFHKRDSVTAVHPLYDTYVAAPGKPPVQADPYGARQVNSFWPSACDSGRDAVIAFQDMATGVASVKITRVRAGTRRGHAFRLSDSPRGAAYRPALACSRGHFVAAWEDTRGGPPRIFAALGALKRVR
jgi:hypothetical protein